MKSKNKMISIVLSSILLMQNGYAAFAHGGRKDPQSGWSTAKKILIPVGIAGAAVIGGICLWAYCSSSKKPETARSGEKNNIGSNGVNARPKIAGSGVENNIGSSGANTKPKSERSGVENHIGSNGVNTKSHIVENTIESLKASLLGAQDKYELSYILWECRICISGLVDACGGVLYALAKRIVEITPETFASEKVECGKAIVDLVTSYLHTNPNAHIISTFSSEGWLEKDRRSGEIQRYRQWMEEQEQNRLERKKRMQEERERLAAEEKRKKEEWERIEREEREKKEREHLEKEQEEEEKRKRSSERMAALKFKHDDFIAKFIEYVEDGTDFEENLSKHWCETYIPHEEERHKRLIDYIKKSPNKDLCEKLYAELSWICYVLKEYSYDRFRFNYGLSWMIGVFGCFDSSKSVYERRDYREFWVDDTEFKYFADDLIKFYEYDNSDFAKAFCYYLNIMRWLNSTTLKRLNSDILSLQGIRIRLERLKSGSDPTMKVLAEGAEKLILESFEKKLLNKKEKIEKEKKPKEAKSFDKSQVRYVPYGKDVGNGSYGSVSVYWDTVKNKKVAVKVLNGKSFSSETLRKMQIIDSPYVAKALDLVDIGDGKKGLVMEYVHCGEFMVPAMQRITDDNKLLDICIQLAKAFEAFDKAGLHHTDLTHYGNILLDDHDNVKIVDYDDASSNVSMFSSCDSVYFNMIPALEQIGTVLASTNEDLFKNFSEKFGAGFEVKRYDQQPIFAELKRYYKDRMNFEYLVKTLEDMKKECESSAKAVDTAAA